jgi:protein TonB
MFNTLLKITLFLSIIFAFTSTSYSQEESYSTVAEVLPQPVGGLSAINKHITYPKTAKNAGISGKVYVLAFINESGTVDNTKIIKSLGGGCDEEVVNAVKSSKFTPGKNDGVPIKMKLILSFTFKES